MPNQLRIDECAGARAAPPALVLCTEMPELLVMHQLNDLPGDLRQAVDDHISGCARCATLYRALVAAAEAYDTRRRS